MHLNSLATLLERTKERNIHAFHDEQRVPPRRSGESGSFLQSLTSIATTDKKTLCGVNAACNIFCASKGLDYTPDWRRIDGDLKWVVVWSKDLWGVSVNDEIWKNPKQVTLTDGILCGTGRDDTTWYGMSSGQPNWTNVPGTVKQIPFDGALLCGVQASNDVWCADSTLRTSPNWRHLWGHFTHVEVGGDRVYRMWFTPPLVSMNPWIQLPSTPNIRQLNFDGKNMCGVDSADDVWCASETFTDAPSWRSMGRKLMHVVEGVAKHVVVANGILAAVARDDSIWVGRSLNDLKWVKVSGSLGNLEFDGMHLCGTTSTDSICAVDVRDTHHELSQPSGVVQARLESSRTSVRNVTPLPNAGQDHRTASRSSTPAPSTGLRGFRTGLRVPRRELQEPRSERGEHSSTPRVAQSFSRSTLPPLIDHQGERRWIVESTVDHEDRSTRRRGEKSLNRQRFYRNDESQALYGRSRACLLGSLANARQDARSRVGQTSSTTRVPFGAVHFAIGNEATKRPSDQVNREERPSSKRQRTAPELFDISPILKKKGELEFYKERFFSWRRINDRDDPNQHIAAQRDSRRTFVRLENENKMERLLRRGNARAQRRTPADDRANRSSGRRSVAPGDATSSSHSCGPRWEHQTPMSDEAPTCPSSVDIHATELCRSVDGSTASFLDDYDALPESLTTGVGLNEKTIERLWKWKSAHRGQIEALQQRCSTLEERCESLENLVADHESKIDDLTEGSAQCSALESRYEERFQQVQDELIRLRKNEKSRELAHDRLLRSVEEAGSALEVLRGEYHSRLQALEAVKDQSFDVLQLLYAEKNLQSDELFALRNQVEKLHDQLDRLWKIS
ncbi:hypothetical protein FI667_g10843, partial [Globisporangium splendens]